MLLAYFAVWALLRQIKIEVSLEGRAFDDFLLLIDKNTGHGRLNNWILIAASAALLVSFFVYGSDFIALQAAILIGMWVNSHYVSRAPWAVSDTWEAPPSYDWDEEQEDNDASISRSFCWSLDSPFHDLSGELSIDFNTLEIEELRKANPFRLYPELTFKEKINSLLTSEKGYTKIHKILRYIDNQIRESGLGERERLQFILDFVQLPNIKFMGDEECDEIGRPQDYARFPDETLFDGRGDCDCKSALAAILFREAGYRTAYLITKDHAAVAVAFRGKANADLIDIAGSSVLTKDGYIYYFCETTGDGFRIGDLGDTRKEDLEEILYLD
jgi:hypothetical protein